MTLSDYLKMLHSYIGIDRYKQDYIVYLQSIIMRPPKTAEEKKLMKKINIILTKDQWKKRIFYFVFIMGVGHYLRTRQG